MGIVVSLAIAGAVFENEAFHKVLVIMPNVDRSTLRQGITGTDSSYFTTLTTTNRTRVLDAVILALGSVYIVVMIAGAFVLVIACLLPVSCERYHDEPWLIHEPEKETIHKRLSPDVPIQ